MCSLLTRCLFVYLFDAGVTYILKLLDQIRDFQSLHWFDAVQTKFGAEHKDAATALREKEKDKDKISTAQLTLKKLSSILTEFQLLRFSFTGAQVFFTNE